MRNSVIVVVACVVVLGGAYFASRVLVSDVAPPASQVVTVAPEALRPAVQPVPSPAHPGREEAEAAMMAPRNGPLQQVAAPIPHLVEPTNVPPPPEADVAASPFQGQSKELDYVEALLAEPDADLERVRSAHDVLTRCLEQEPGNKRCADAMKVARTRLGGRDVSQVKPQLPTLRTEPPNVVKPVPGPK